MTEQLTDKGKGREKTFDIVVNGRAKEVHDKELSFDEIVALAFDSPPTGENVLFTVTYRKGPDKKHEGSLVEGESVKTKEGMVFNVLHADKS